MCKNYINLHTSKNYFKKICILLMLCMYTENWNTVCSLFGIFVLDMLALSLWMFIIPFTVIRNIKFVKK